MCCLLSSMNVTILLCFHTNTNSVFSILCLRSYRELQEHLYQCWLAFYTNISFTFVSHLWIAITSLFSRFSMHNLLFHLVSPLLPLTCFPISDSYQSGGFRHRLWGGGSCRWGEILVVKKQRFHQEPVRRWQPQELQVSTKAAAITEMYFQAAFSLWLPALWRGNFFFLKTNPPLWSMYWHAQWPDGIVYLSHLLRYIIVSASWQFKLPQSFLLTRRFNCPPSAQPLPTFQSYKKLNLSWHVPKVKHWG